MLTRRTLFGLAGLALGGAPLLARGDEPNAVEFIRRTGDHLAQVINSAAPDPAKRRQLQQIIDQNVDVPGIGRFALGRFWRTASAAQRQEYTRLFHEVLMSSITAKMGEYKGVRFSVGRAVPSAGGTAVHTIIVRPNGQPTNVQWLVVNIDGAPKIEDVIAEGTSLRITQRSDYQSYLRRNGDSVQALIKALRQQVAKASG